MNTLWKLMYLVFALSATNCYWHHRDNGGVEVHVPSVEVRDGHHDGDRGERHEEHHHEGDHR